ncbi:MAG: hypothetical protein V4563_04960 [Pseudomonadota bacterium]
MDTKHAGVADFDVQHHELLCVGHDIKEQRDGWRELCRAAGEAVVETVGLGLRGWCSLGVVESAPG